MKEYKEGKEARLLGVSVDDNPYEYGTSSWTYWWDGWQDANCRMEG